MPSARAWLPALATLVACSGSRATPVEPPAPPLPEPPAPLQDRTCCAFGMDLHAELVGVDVPLFELGNIIDVSGLGGHVYDLREDVRTPEQNGLVYTCRGGWIDTAHVRDSADQAFFLTRHLAPLLARGGTIVVPASDTSTTIVVRAVDPDVLTRIGAAHVAATLARWIVFRIAVWHEAATWYGYESVPGFPERLSAFSVEDLYSDALGARLGAELGERRDVATVEQYEDAARVSILRSLEHLAAQPVDRSRAIMGALDGRWWTSTRRVPDVQLVLRRAFPPDGRELRPWRIEDAFPGVAVPGGVGVPCADASARTVHVPDEIGGLPVASLVELEWRPGAWADDTLSLSDPERVLRGSDLDALVARTHESMRATLGDGFDRPDGPE